MIRLIVDLDDDIGGTAVVTLNCNITRVQVRELQKLLATFDQPTYTRMVGPLNPRIA